MAVIIATDGLGGAAATSANPDDADGGAPEAEEASDGPEDDAEQARQEVGLRGGALWNNVSKKAIQR